MRASSSTAAELSPGVRERILAAARAEFAAHGSRAASVRAGVRAAPEDSDLLFALADQPYLRAEDYDRLIAAADPGGIVHASYAGARGSPVLFGRRHRAELLELSGGEGGRVVIERHPGAARAVELDSERGRDLDPCGHGARGHEHREGVDRVADPLDQQDG